MPSFDPPLDLGYGKWEVLASPDTGVAIQTAVVDVVFDWVVAMTGAMTKLGH